MSFNHFFGKIFSRQPEQTDAHVQASREDQPSVTLRENSATLLGERLWPEKSLARQRFQVQAWIVLILALACIVALYLFQPTLLLNIFQAIAGWARMLVFIGFVGIYPVSYLAYRSFSDDAKRAPQR